MFSVNPQHSSRNIIHIVINALHNALIAIMYIKKLDFNLISLHSKFLLYDYIFNILVIFHISKLDQGFKNCFTPNQIIVIRI